MMMLMTWHVELALDDVVLEVAQLLQLADQIFPLLLAHAHLAPSSSSSSQIGLGRAGGETAAVTQARVVGFVAVEDGRALVAAVELMMMLPAWHRSASGNEEVTIRLMFKL